MYFSADHDYGSSFEEYLQYQVWFYKTDSRTHLMTSAEQSKQIYPIPHPITSSLTVSPFIALTIEQQGLSHMNRDLVTW